MSESLFPIPAKVKVKLTPEKGKVGGNRGEVSPWMRHLAAEGGTNPLGGSAILGREPLVVLVDQFAVALRRLSWVGEAQLILADEGLEPLGQLDFDGAQGSDDLFAQEIGGGGVVAEGTVGRLAQSLKGPIERAAELPVAGKGAAQVFGVAEELA